MTPLSGSGRIVPNYYDGFNSSLEFAAVNSQPAGLLEEGENQPPTKDRPHYPQRENWPVQKQQRHVRDRKNIRKKLCTTPMIKRL